MRKRIICFTLFTNDIFDPLNASTEAVGKTIGPMMVATQEEFCCPNLNICMEQEISPSTVQTYSFEGLPLA